MPNSETLTALDREARTTRSVSADLGITVVSAEGSTLVCENGERVLDLTGALGSNLLGYGQAAVQETLFAQLADLTHVAWQCSSTAKASLLAALAPHFPPNSKFLFGVSGSDGIEAAVKIARSVTGAYGVLAFSGSFHGKSAGVLELTASERLREGLIPLRQTPLRLPYPIDVSGGSEESEQSAKASLDVLRGLLKVPDRAASEVGAVIVEGLQGSSMTAPSPTFLRGLREITREFGLLLILDEVFSGIGRTGKFFSFDYADIDPDLIVMGKALGAGLPISIVAGRGELLDALGPALQSSTFSGHALSCAAGVAVLAEVESVRFVERVQSIREKFTIECERVNARRGEHAKWVITGRGLMIGLRLGGGGVSAKLDAQLQRELRRRGYFLLAAGDCLRLSPAASLTDADITRFWDALDASVDAVQPQSGMAVSA